MKPKVIDAPFYHGTSTEIKIGDYLVPSAKAMARKKMSRVYVTDNLSAAIFYAKRKSTESGGSPVVYKVVPDYWTMQKVNKTDYITSNAKVVGVVPKEEMEDDTK